jgi:hypothetical protein
MNYLRITLSLASCAERTTVRDGAWKRGRTVRPI